MLIQGVPGALVNILKGFRTGKANNGINFHEDFKSGFSNLDRIFLKKPFPDPHESITNDQEEIELDIGKYLLRVAISIYGLMGRLGLYCFSLTGQMGKLIKFS